MLVSLSNARGHHFPDGAWRFPVRVEMTGQMPDGDGCRPSMAESILDRGFGLSAQKQNDFAL